MLADHLSHPENAVPLSEFASTFWESTDLGESHLLMETDRGVSEVLVGFIGKCYARVKIQDAHLAKSMLKGGIQRTSDPTFALVLRDVYRALDRPNVRFTLAKTSRIAVTDDFLGRTIVLQLAKASLSATRNGKPLRVVSIISRIIASVGTVCSKVAAVPST